MTLRMLDSVTPGNLPPGADAYAGYVDGRFANLTALRARFPGKRILEIAVFASSDAEAADCETGDMMPSQIGSWVLRQRRRGIDRPVVYASASVMPEVLRQLTISAIARSEVRLWSAHYGDGKHICGPGTCAFRDSAGRTVPACDGTQWRDNAPGTGSSLVDESVLSGDFFQEAPMPLTSDDLKAITNAVWQSQVIFDPAGPAGQQRTAAHVLTDNGRQIRAVAAQVAALVGQDDPAALAKAILAGLSPAAIASAVAAAVGPEVAQEVVAALAAQLGK